MIETLINDLLQFAKEDFPVDEVSTYLEKISLNDSLFIYKLRQNKLISYYLHNPPKTLEDQKAFDVISINIIFWFGDIKIIKKDLAHYFCIMLVRIN